MSIIKWHWQKCNKATHLNLPDLCFFIQQSETCLKRESFAKYKPGTTSYSTYSEFSFLFQTGSLPSQHYDTEPWLNRHSRQCLSSKIFVIELYHIVVMIKTFLHAFGRVICHEFCQYIFLKYEFIPEISMYHVFILLCLELFTNARIIEINL